MGHFANLFSLNLSPVSLVDFISQSRGKSLKLYSKFLQCVPLATEPGISLTILTPMKILQRNLNKSTLVVWKMKGNVSVVRLIYIYIYIYIYMYVYSVSHSLPNPAFL